MAPFLLSVYLSLSATAFVASANLVTWGALNLIYHGEKIPVLHEGPYNLTPLGANQLLSAGQFIRGRYLSSNSSATDASIPINGLSTDVIDNSQMEVMTMTDEYITASALAFMQGLYPPRGGTGLQVDEESILGNGTLEQYPLNGTFLVLMKHSPSFPEKLGI